MPNDDPRCIFCNHHPPLDPDTLIKKKGRIDGASSIDQFLSLHHLDNPQFLDKDKTFEVPPETSYAIQSGDNWFHVQSHEGGKLTGPLVFANKGKTDSVAELYKRKNFAAIRPEIAVATLMCIAFLTAFFGLASPSSFAGNFYFLIFFLLGLVGLSYQVNKFRKNKKKPAHKPHGTLKKLLGRKHIGLR